MVHVSNPIGKYYISNHKEKIKLGLKHAINSDFLKAVARYMLVNKGNNSQIRIKKFIDSMNYKNLVDQEQLKDFIIDLKRTEVQDYLREKFGITLTFNDKTITYNTLSDKKHYYIK